VASPISKVATKIGLRIGWCSTPLEISSFYLWTWYMNIPAICCKTLCPWRYLSNGWIVKAPYT